MNRKPELTDALLRRALAPDGALQAPAGLLEAVVGDVDRIRPRPGFLTAWPGVPSLTGGRLRWALVAAAAIVALVAGLLLAAGAPEPVPVQSEARFGSPTELRVAGVGPDEVWVETYSGELWHRTAAGWRGPELTPGVVDTRGVAALPGGRVAITSDHGTWVRERTGDWIRLSDGSSSAVAVDASGTIWVTEWFATNDVVEPGVAAYRQSKAGWDRTWIPCPSAGGRIAIASDGSVWTGGIAYLGTPGLARIDGSRCSEVFPVGEGVAADITGLAAGPDGVVAIGISTMVSNDEWTGTTLLWDSSAWEIIRRDSAATTWALAFGPGGDLYAGRGDGTWRYRDGSWTLVVPESYYLHLSLTPDGTLWYVVALPDGSASLGHVAIADLPR